MKPLKERLKILKESLKNKTNSKAYRELMALYDKGKSLIK